MRSMLSWQWWLWYTYSEPDKEVIVMNEKWSIIHDKTNWEIIITDNYPFDWNNNFNYRKKIVIADKNLWATKVWNEWDPFDEEHCWKWYQWWNNYWFPYNVERITKVSTTKVNVDSYNEHPSTYSSDTWISVTDGARMEAWDRDNYWFWIWWDQQDFLSRKWPCPSWRHLPHKFERLALANELLRIFGYDDDYISLDLMNLILSPYDWYLLWDKTIYRRDSYLEFWWCDNDNSNPSKWAQFLMAKQVSSNRIAVLTPTHYKAYWLHIRPFKNIYDWVMTLQQLEALWTPDLVLQELNKHKWEYLDVYWFYITLCLSNYEYEFYTNLNNSESHYKQWFYNKGWACS